MSMPGDAARSAAFAVKRATVLRASDASFRQLVANEARSREELVADQTRAVVEHARWAMGASPFYRELYSSAGLSQDDLRDPMSFSALPIVEKAHIRDHFDSFLTPDAGKFGAVSRTGGSTGQPVRLMRDTRASAQPLEWRLFRWWGVHPYDNIGIVFRHVRTGRQQFAHAAKWWPSRRIQLDAYEINERSVSDFVDLWAQTRPRLLTGYAGGLLEYARTVARLKLSPAPPIAIASTASPIRAEDRAEIEEVLRAPLYDHYRSSEIPWMAGECRERAGHHIFIDRRVIEIVDSDGQPTTTEGQVVATDLTNRVFPLIRYRLGDRTTLISEPCACGVPLPRVALIKGRDGDGLRLPDGSWVAAEAVFQLFSMVPDAVAQFQVHQKADFSVDVLVVSGAAPDAEDQIEQVIAGFRRRLHNQVAVGWRSVQGIPHDGGKIRYVRSDAIPTTDQGAR